MNLTCTIRDQAALPAGERGTRDDYDAVYMVTVKVVNIRLQSVTYSGGGQHTVYSDFGSAYSGPHWYDGNGDGADDSCQAVCYTGNSTMAASTVIVTTPEAAALTGTVLVRSQPGQWGSATAFASQSAAVTNGAITTTNAPATGTLPAGVAYDPLVAASWEASQDGGATWHYAGLSRTEVFVTTGTPQCSMLYRTVAHLACAGYQPTASSVWNSFSGRSVHAWQQGDHSYSRPLYYYRYPICPGPVPCTDQTQASELLMDGNGQCHSWADLFVQCLRVHGMSPSITRVNPPTEAGGFAVKNVQFGQIADVLPWEYRADGLSYAPSGVSGQNMATPAAKAFGCHFVVRYPTGAYTYYDPSYGVTYSGANLAEAESDFALDAVDAWLSGTWAAKRSRVPWIPSFE